MFVFVVVVVLQKLLSLQISRYAFDEKLLVVEDFVDDDEEEVNVEPNG